jgi:X-X-X-Leu-X-X-Gly heptad repeat protein
LLDEARSILNRELQQLGSSVDVELRDRISTIHSNAGALDNQSKQLRNKTNQLAKTTKQWGGMADSARGKLKV